MLLVDLLWLILSVVLARAVWRFIDGISQGVSGASSPRSAAPTRRDGHVPATGVQMERDPVCGTYVVPARAVVVADGARRVYFCSAACRDAYRARTA
jgi:YHS domain-containing protein